MEQHIRRLGQEAAQEANVAGLHEKLLDYLGRLQFRTSYSQNVLRHSLEVAYLTGLMAEEIGLNGAARPPLRAACTTSARRPTTRWKGATPPSAPS